jgi:hypothetical protein
VRHSHFCSRKSAKRLAPSQCTKQFARSARLVFDQSGKYVAGRVIDHGAVVRSGTGRATPRMIRFVIGNPLIMRQMAKHARSPGAGFRPTPAALPISI